MTLIVEDGTGKTDSEAYASVAAVDAYLLKTEPSTAWSALTEEQKEQKLRLATIYLTQKYTSRWKGCRRTQQQALDWPRDSVMLHGYSLPSDTLPGELLGATAGLAVRALSGPLAPDLEAEVASEAVGPISVTYFRGGRQGKKYDSVEMALKPILKGDGNSIPVYRS